MSTEIVRYGEFPTEGEWAQMQKMAQSLVGTGLIPNTLDTAAKVMAVALTGRELGLGFMTAIRGLNVIQGKVEMSTQLMLAVAQRTGELESYNIDGDGLTARFMVKRKGRPPYTSVFTMADAKALKLDTKDQWIKQPATMLRWRAISAGLRVMFPDALLGVYSPGEISEDVLGVNTWTGEIIDATPQIPAPAPAPHHSAPEAENKGGAASTLPDLWALAAALWGKDRVEMLEAVVKTQCDVDEVKALTPEQIADCCAHLHGLLDQKAAQATLV